MNKQVLEKPIQQIKRHKESISDEVKIQDVDKYIALNSDVEDPETIAELRKFLVEEKVLEVEGDPEHGETVVKEINELKMLDEDDSEFKSLLDLDFDHSIYRDVESKKELAQEYANWLIEDADIIPVWINGATIFYRYNPVNHTWNEIDYEMIKKKAKKDLKRDYNSHLKRELKHQIKDHYNFIEFDQMGLEPNEVLLRNGELLNLESKEKREIEKTDYALNCLNTEYNPDAESNGLKEFIERTIDKEEMVKAFQEYLGYTFTWPSDKYEKMLLILGNTDTGKSTLLKVIEELFQKSNVTKISFPQIGMDRAFHVQDLKDSVLNLDSDMDDQAIRRKSRVKKVISKEEIFVEPKGEKGFNLRPKANFIVTSNDAPDDAGATDAYYNRFLTLTATSRIPEEEKDRELIEKLTTEENLQWLLNWSIEGLERLREQNSFSHNTTEYETKKIWDKFGNSVQKFIAEQITVDTEKGFNIKTTDVYEAYELWCETELEDKISRNKFIAQASAHPDLTKQKTFDKDGVQASCFIDIKVKDFDM